MNEFQKAESKGREKTEKYLKTQNIKSYSFTEGQMDRTDGQFINKNKKLEVFEIKVRGKLYPTWMLEVSKLKAIVQRMKDEGATDGHYYCIYQNTMYDYSIRDVVKFVKENPQSVKEYNCPVSTMADNGRIIKKTIDLPLHLAKITEL